MKATSLQLKNINKWFAIPASGYVLIAIILYLIGGYHNGFLALNLMSAIFPAVFWQCITFLGDEHLALTLMLLIASKRPYFAYVLLWSVLSGLLLSRLLKLGVSSYRPLAVLPQETFYLIGAPYKYHSFPSGHTQLAFTIASSMFVFLQNRYTRLLILTVASLVGISRVAVGVHWPIDILIGAAIGLLAARLGIWIAEYSIRIYGQQVEWQFIIWILLIFPIRLILGYNPGLEVPFILSPLIGMLVLTWFAQHIVTSHFFKP